VNRTQLETPVALIIFNRPDTTEKVFFEIARMKPTMLLVVADGPRPERIGEVEKCKAARAVIERVNWDCEVTTNFSEINMGCRLRVSTGLDWIFNNVEEAIVLEDDCLPHPSFFRFCEEMLIRYRNNHCIMQICGFNALHKKKPYDYSYYFSKFGPIWGWASWRRAWQHYDVNMTLWPLVKKERAYRFFCEDQKETIWRLKVFDQTYQGKIDTWDYQWAFAKHINSGLSIIPHGNLIVNIGFGVDSTNTGDSQTPLASLTHKGVDFPLRHPPYICRNNAFDREYLKYMVFGNRSLLRRLRRLLLKLQSLLASK